jgi:multicomponent Na+:H+ antiporter subunit G
VVEVRVVGEVVMLAGTAFVLIGAIGTLRFGDVYGRMHAAAKVPTLGLLLTVVGAELLIDGAPTQVALALAAVLALITGPVSAHLVGRAAHRRQGVALPADMVDDLARDQPPDGPPGSS